MDPALAGFLGVIVSSGATLAATLFVQRHNARKEADETVKESEDGRIADLKASHAVEMANLKAFYTQLLSDRDARNAELRADLAATEADLRLHNDALLKAATSQEQMVRMMHDLIGTGG
jgi:hypothetical protein